MHTISSTLPFGYIIERIQLRLPISSLITTQMRLLPAYCIEIELHEN